RGTWPTPSSPSASSSTSTRRTATASASSASSAPAALEPAWPASYTTSPMTTATRRRQRLLRYAFMKLTRDFDARFEALLLTGRVSKWYRGVGNEATTVPAGLALGPGDALCTLHRDLGAILAVYLDPARTFPDFGFGSPDGLRPDPEALL